MFKFIFTAVMRCPLLALPLLTALPACSQQPKIGSNGKPMVRQEVAVMKTSEGDIVVRFYEQEAPKHVANFKKLVKEGYYDGTTFHRVIQNFMVQGGDPNSKDSDPQNDGQGGPNYTIPAEFNAKRFHKRGALAAARQSDQVNPRKESSGSQFYIVHGQKFGEDMLRSQEASINQGRMQQIFSAWITRPENAGVKDLFIKYQQTRNMDSLQALSMRIEPILVTELDKTGAFKFSDEQKQIYATIGGAPHLDGDYTVFGEVVSGMDVVDKIAVKPVDGRSRPIDNITVSKITLETMDVEDQ